MGFGSYDESEQENQEIDVSSNEESEAKGGEFDGDEEFDFGGADTTELVDKLQDIKNE